MALAWLATALSLQVSASLARPMAHSTRAAPDSKFAVKVNLGGRTFISKGLVGFGLIPSNFRESTGMFPYHGPQTSNLDVQAPL